MADPRFFEVEGPFNLEQLAQISSSKIGGNKTASAETGTESNTGIMKRLKAKTLKDMFFPKAE